jgi:hypothetical protein
MIDFNVMSLPLATAVPGERRKLLRDALRLTL